MANDGKYELFGLVDGYLQSEMKKLVISSLESELFADSLIAGAMTMALFYIDRMEKEGSFDQTLSARILVIKGSEDNSTLYMNSLNDGLTAQKQNVFVDACVLDNESGLLQQACDITGGTYLEIPKMAGLFQYLLWIFLPDPNIRSKLTLPPKAQVDYRAACFCHRNLTDIGYDCFQTSGSTKVGKEEIKENSNM